MSSEYVISKAFFEEWDAEEFANEIEMLRTDDWDEAYDFWINSQKNWKDNTSCKKYMKTILRYDGKEIYYLAVREHQDIPLANKILQAIKKKSAIYLDGIRFSSNRHVYSKNLINKRDYFDSDEDYNLVKEWLDNEE